MQNKLRWMAALALGLLGAGQAAAATPGEQDDAAIGVGLAVADAAVAAGSAIGSDAASQDSEADNDGGWQFSVTPYLWAAGISGDIQLADGEPVEIDTSFTDILRDLKFTAMMAAEARHDRFVVLGDIVYLSVGSDADGPAGFVDADVDLKTLFITMVAGYRVVDQGPLFVDLFAGGRLTSLDIGVELTGPIQTVERDNSKSSIAPVIGARFRAPLGDRWGFAVYGDLAGLGATNNDTWQLMGTVQYDLSDRWRFSAGYRHVAVDFDKRDFHADLALSGPIFGASYRF